MATFSSKISTAYALGLMTKAAKNDLNIIKAIRNNAAHRIRDFSFENTEIRQRCSSLTLITQPDGIESSPFQEKWMSLGVDSPKAKFVLSSYNIIVNVIVRKLHTLQLKAAVVLFGGLYQNKISLEEFKKVAEKVHIEPYLKDIYESLR
jgi:hydrogenase maturation factor HypF (carbamoyltransferase family)